MIRIVHQDVRTRGTTHYAARFVGNVTFTRAIHFWLSLSQLSNTGESGNKDGTDDILMCLMPLSRLLQSAWSVGRLFQIIVWFGSFSRFADKSPKQEGSFSLKAAHFRRHPHKTLTSLFEIRLISTDTGQQAITRQGSLATSDS